MFVGREEYLKDLNDFWGRDSGVLVTCRGRRRIGKSTLIEEFASTSAERFYSIDGLAPHKRMTDELQRRHFCEKVAEYAGRAFKMASAFINSSDNVARSMFSSADCACGSSKTLSKLKPF